MHRVNTAVMDWRNVRNDKKGEKSMWILILEMLLALVIIGFIIWWTMRARADYHTGSADKVLNGKALNQAPSDTAVQADAPPENSGTGG